MKLVTVVGARPQFIKAAPVGRALRALPGVQEVLVHTGQHYDDAMSAVFSANWICRRPTTTWASALVRTPRKPGPCCPRWKWCCWPSSPPA